MGREFNEEKYKTVLNCCELVEDLENMIKGDSTLVGEDGKLLSGGQKSRICLARVIYSDSDVYLLDDPFASVDSKIAENIMNKCIKGYIKDKIRVVVVNDAESLHFYDKIIVLSHGYIEFNGSYEIMNLDSSSVNFLSLGTKQYNRKQKLKQKFQGDNMKKRRASADIENKEMTIQLHQEEGVSFSMVYNFLIFGFKSFFLLIIFLLFCFCVQLFYVYSQF